MPKQYEHTILEVEVKKRLKRARDELGLPSLSATVTYLIDHLPAQKQRPRPGVMFNK